MVGIVVIGRNEGELLKICLLSVLKQTKNIIYVDSGSADASVSYAKSLGINVVELDMSIPFCAGRARNEGFYKVIQQWPETNHVQFIDGDCELEERWLSFAEKSLMEDSSWAIVAGRRRERLPGKSIYNLLCDIEWNTPVGNAKSCGGDFMIKAIAFKQVDGFNPQVIAGEEPELCYRLRQNNWEIHRLDHPMTLHDAAMTRFSQWWKRSVRSGHAFAQGMAMHGRSLANNNVRHTIRIWIWGGVLPIIIFTLTPINFTPAFILLVILYTAQTTRIALNLKKKGFSWGTSFIYGFAIVLARWPQLFGQATFFMNKIRRKHLKIIEYK